MSKGLFFDTSSKEGVLCLINDGKIERVHYFPFGFRESEDLVSLIKEMQGERVLSYVAVGVGPGSYTGIRASATVAMTLCFASDLPCISLSSLDILTPQREGPFLSIMDAKRNRIFVRSGKKIGENVEWTGEPKLILIEECQQKLTKEVTLVSSTIETLQPKFSPDMHWESGDRSQNWVAKACHKKWEAKDFAPIDPLKLLYLQDPYINTPNS